MQDRDYPIHMILTRLHRFFSHIRVMLCGLIVFLMGSNFAFSEAPSPRIKPLPPKLSEYLSDQEARKFRSALRSVDRKSWSELQSIRSSVSDPIVKDLLFWLESVENPRADLSTLTYVTQRLSDWPRMTKVRAAGEALLFDRYQGAQATLSWFGGVDPVSGEGRAALARAYFETGNEVAGNEWLKRRGGNRV